MKHLALITWILVVLQTLAAFAKQDEYPQRFEPAALIVEDDGKICTFSEQTKNFLSCYKFVYHDVYGHSKAEIRRSLSNNGPRTAWSKTETTIKWAEDNNKQCMIFVDSVIFFPNLKTYDELQQNLQLTWNKMLKALRRHEVNHHRIALREAWEEFRNDCPDPSKAVRRSTGKNILYDQETAHGYTEGVHLK